jgi:hypothetical protein
MTGGHEQHKELIRRLYDEVFTAGRMEVVDELMTDDYVNHDPPPGAGHTREDVKGIAARSENESPASALRSTGSSPRMTWSRCRGVRRGRMGRPRSSSASSSGSRTGESPSAGGDRG